MTAGAVPRRMRATVGYDDALVARLAHAETLAGGDAVRSPAHAPTLAADAPTTLFPYTTLFRSEERRVGKECI